MPIVGLEPTTTHLKGERSTNWARRADQDLIPVKNNFKLKCSVRGLNSWPWRYKHHALPTELTELSQLSINIYKMIMIIAVWQLD